jgi:hypothetical protein
MAFTTAQFTLRGDLSRYQVTESLVDEFYPSHKNTLEEAWMDGNKNQKLGPALAARAEMMHSRDRWSALLILAALWVTLIYTYVAVPHGFFATPVGLVLLIAAALLLLFNTSSVFAMLRHYREDRDYIYGQDLHHLDQNRQRLHDLSLRPAHVDTDPGAP